MDENGNPVEGKVKTDMNDVVSKALEARYRPKDVREWLAKYNDNAELALEKVVEMLNDRIQRQVTAEAKLEAYQSQSKQELDEKDKLYNELKKRVVEFEQAEAARLAAEKDSAVSKALNDRFPATAKGLKLALKDAGYELDHDGKEVVLIKGKKQVKLEDALTGEFYEAYPFVKPASDPPFGGGGSDSAISGEDIAKQFNSGKKSEDRFNFG